MNTVSTVRTVASRVGAKRTMSTTPKMHKAKDVWKQLESTRPPQGHPHLVFHPPYSKVTAAFGVITVVSLGYGAMYMGMRHQQYKQGYWKK